ncbi:MAG: DUF4139 domain-containing protein [Crocinitomicaceae bacterium]|nr:DUF4139 domain-containing protein [Crocinitomicaceae bacterium]
MKKSFILSCLLFASSWLRATEKETIKATLTEVTVYAQGAQMHNKANYSINAGVTEIIIEGISAFIDPKSIQVKGTGDLVLLDTKFSFYYPQPTNALNQGASLKITKDIQLLEDSLRVMDFDIRDIQDEINVLNASKSIIASNGMVRSIGKVNDSINLLKQTIEYYTLKMNELNKKIIALEKKRQEKAFKKILMETRLTDLKNYQNNNGEIENNKSPIPRITITVSAKTAVSGKLNFSYVVSNAGWTPIYDLRSDASTGKIELTYKAEVFQSSGLDWDNIKLNISTNNPYVNKTKPTLNPWYIDYNLYKLEDKKGRMDKLQEVQITSQALFNRGYAYSEDMDDETNIMGADQFTTVVHRLISAEFKIDLPYSIKSNNEKHMVLIKSTNLDTKFKYYSVPKLDASVYLVAQMTKLDELQLVPGQANIFFDGSYIGETYIDPTTMDDTLNLSLGKDPSIVVKRTLLKKELKDRIIGDKRERTFAYSIEISNQKSSSIEIVIQDQLPITQNADINIESDNFAKGRFDERTGLLEWSFILKAKENKVIDYNFRVKHAKDKNLEI